MREWITPGVKSLGSGPICMVPGLCIRSLALRIY